MNRGQYMLPIFLALIAGATYFLLANQALADEELPQQQLKAFESAIKAHGYQCPCASLGFFKGLSPRGQKFKIFCGPNEEKVYPNLIYKVVLDPDMETVIKSPEKSKVWVEPWE